MGVDVVRREVGLVGEATGHRRGGGIELVHGRQAQEQLDGSHHAGLVVVRAIDGFAAGVGADDLGDRAVAVDVVEAGLRVVFDDEDARLRPELAVADGFDDAAEGEVVIGDCGFGRLHAGARAGGVVVGQQHDAEVLELARLFGRV